MDNFIQNKIGKFFVIEGIDGSGKTTQIRILKEKLEEYGYKIVLADFPQYNQKSAGLVEEYLSGKYGELNEINPYAASCFYAGDRFDASFKIKKWIQKGFIVLANRYVTSNMAHQGSKINNPLEKKVFYEWVQNLEYKIFRIPKPDKTFILNLDSSLAQDRSKKRHRIDWKGKVRDIHEENISHLQKSQKIFLEIAAHYPNMKLINYNQDGKILNKDEINNILFHQIISSLHNNKFPNFLNEKKYHKKESKQKNQAEIKSLELINIEFQERIILKTNILIKHSKNLKFIIPHKNLLQNNIFIENNFIAPEFKGQLKIYLRNNEMENFQINKGEILGKIYWEN
jgi:dTMP kinase